MDDLVKILGGTTVVVAGLAWLCRELMKHFFSVDLETHKSQLQYEQTKEIQDFKLKQARGLSELRTTQEAKLESLREQAQQRLELFKSELTTMEHHAHQLLEKRGDAYARIWKLTGTLNLFGPTKDTDGSDLSQHLSDWYFEHGHLLTEVSKQRYFLVQEALNFARLRSLTLHRPSDQTIYGDPNRRPLEILRTYRSEKLAVPIENDNHRYETDDLRRCVERWKASLTNEEDPDSQSEMSWVLLQFLLSAFRTGIADELGSREETPAFDDPEDSRST